MRFAREKRLSPDDIQQRQQFGNILPSLPDLILFIGPLYLRSHTGPVLQDPFAQLFNGSRAGVGTKVKWADEENEVWQRWEDVPELLALLNVVRAQSLF